MELELEWRRGERRVETGGRGEKRGYSVEWSGRRNGCVKKKERDRERVRVCV